ncbi:DUF3558 domain-containing protein [Saccharothrix variisporea]|uniref:DUF3558 domain-containing protein n=1 Tax=Saccharothrix variisporea TaxID=543527 RepID=A0A495XA72_9PSEU|nr:hypothetical protein [Saccharothrix variisporea]RKT69734.1 hypothetical protein DFJ66_2972 [Saccharothrix variisporea]
MRRSTTLTATLALALLLGLSACATTVTGSAKPAAGGTSAGKTTSGKPSSTKTSTSGKKTAVSTTVTKPGSSTGDNLKIGTRKKSEGYDSCDLLTPEEVAAAVGAQKAGDKGCVQSTEDPFTLVLFRVGFDFHEGDAREFEVGGNTAYEVKEDGSCTVVVVLDQPQTAGLIPAFTANVTPFDEGGNPCDAALKLAQKGFEKIPNA